MNPSRVRRRSGLGDYGEKPIRRYKLNAALSAGGNAQAYWVYWDTTAAAYVATDGASGRANQTVNLYSGPNNATGNTGDFGYAAYFSDRQQWEPIGGGGASQTVKKVTFVCPEALTSQAFLGDCPVVNDWYSNAGVDSITAYNEAGWQADAGAEGYAEWRPSDSTWVITLLPCPSGNS